MNVVIKTLKKYEVVGGLGRLCQFPKTVIVMGVDEDDALGSAMNPIRDLITEQDFNGDRNAPMLSKIINFNTIKEVV
jgi:hypothetical protein